MVKLGKVRGWRVEVKVRANLPLCNTVHLPFQEMQLSAFHFWISSFQLQSKEKVSTEFNK